MNIIEDIKNIKIVDNNIQVICRINPVHSNTEFEINEAIFYGANFIMLPMFTTSNEVDYVYRLINGRAKLILLFETPQSISKEYGSVKGIPVIPAPNRPGLIPNINILSTSSE